jgi:phosphatidylglycerophosphatase A
MRRFGIGIATIGGLGHAPFAPGTVGSAVGVGIHLLVWSLAPAAQVLLCVAVTVVGVWASDVAAKALRSPDPRPVIVDEVAGQLLTLLLTGASLWGVAAGFFFFRLFDVIKPWPANRLEELPGGLGVMADDLMAALYAHVALRGLMAVVPGVL